MARMFPIAVASDHTYWTVGLGSDLSVFSQHLAADGTSTSGGAQHTGVTASDMPTIACDGTNVLITCRDANNSLRTIRYNGSSWGSWNNLGGNYVDPVVTG